MYRRVSPTPVSIVSEMITPAVLINIGGVFINGLLAAYTRVLDRLYALNREQVGILKGADGGLLVEDRLPVGEGERLGQIRAQMPLVARRVRGIRNAIVVFACAIGLLVLSVVGIAFAVTAGSEAFEFVALGLVLAGTLAEFAGVATLAAVLVRSTDAAMYETRRVGELG
jgi:hypothetical protein